MSVKALTMTGLTITRRSKSAFRSAPGCTRRKEVRKHKGGGAVFVDLHDQLLAPEEHLASRFVDSIQDRLRGLSGRDSCATIPLAPSNLPRLTLGQHFATEHREQSGHYKFPRL